MGSLAEQQACLEPVAPWGEGPPDREEQTLTEVLTQELYLAYMTVYEQGCGSLPDDLSSEAQHHNLFYQKSQVFVFSSSSRPFGECLDSEVSRPVRRQGLWWGLKMVTALQGPVSVSEMEKNLHPEFLAKQVSTAARGSPALLLSGDSSLCDHTLCCWKRKLQVWSQRNWAESPPLPPVAGFHPGLWSSDGVISEERKDCAFPQEGGSWLCHISSTGQHRVGRVGALKRVMTVTLLEG